MPFPRKSQTPQTAPKETEVIAKPKPKGKVKPQGKIGSVRGKTPDTVISKRYNRNKELTMVEKLAIRAIKATGKSNEQTAIIAGVSKGTVHKVNHDNSLIDPEVLDRVKKDLAGQSYLLAEAAGKQAMNTIQDASAYQAAGIRHYAIEDALNIERGAPPSQVNQIQVNVQLTQLQDEIGALITKATAV